MSIRTNFYNLGKVTASLGASEHRLVHNLQEFQDKSIVWSAIPSSQFWKIYSSIQLVTAVTEFSIQKNHSDL